MNVNRHKPTHKKAANDDCNAVSFVQMIDTVQLKAYLPGKVLDHLIPISVPLTRRRLPTYVINPDTGSRLPRITAYKTPNETTHLEVEVSVPRFKFGHNSQLPTESEALAAIKELCTYVTDRTRIDFPIERALVSRVDFARDWISDGKTSEIIRRLAGTTLPRRTRLLYDFDTIYFDPKATRRTNRILIYNKYQEVCKKRSMNTDELKVARNKIRFEISLRTPKAIKLHLGRFGLTATYANEVILQSVSDTCIDALWEDLNFPFEDCPLRPLPDTLRQEFSGNKLAKLLGYMALSDAYGPSFHTIESLKISLDSYRRANRDLKSVGLSLTSLP